jgi:glycosyltransferase involved in cell wall biosynthesis
MLKEMILLFKLLKKRKEDALFLIITPDKAELVYQITDKEGIKREDLKIISAERKEVPFLLAKSHLSVFFVKPSFSKKASSPTKMGEILGMGLPIIANKNMGDNEFLFQKYECGVLVEDFSEQSFENALQNLEKLTEIPQKHLKNIASDYFSLEKGIEKYAKVYEKLLKF